MLVVDKLEEKYIESLFELIKVYSDQYLLLPKSVEELKKESASFRVLVENDQVIACVMLDLFTETLAEVRTLAVAQDYKGKGFGKLLVKDCEQRAKDLGIKRIFALTYEDKFFHNLGYTIVDKESLPEKVLKTCVHCAQYSNCQEIAVVKDL